MIYVGEGKRGCSVVTALWIGPLLALLGGYLLGSIPFGVLLTRAVGAGDLRTIGSGNIGATNVLRTGRKGLALHWPCGLVFAAVWIGAMALTRYSSVGGMAAAISTPVSAAWNNQFDLALLFLGCALLVLWKHRGNLERLLAGTEPRIGRKEAGDQLG